MSERITTVTMRLSRLRRWGLFIIAGLALSGCSHAGSDDYTAGDIRGINHTPYVINYIDVNGHGGPNVSAYGDGGGYCCVMLPMKWIPGMKAHIEWEVDPDPTVNLPPLGTEEFRQAYVQHANKYQKHSAIVPIPEYGEERCGITVHFLPCDQIKVTTVCDGYGTPNYPIKEPRHMKEPKECQKK